MITPIDQYEEKLLLKIRELPEDKRGEVLDFMDFLRTRIGSKSEREGSEYSYYLMELRKKIRERGGLKVGKTKGEIVEELRDTRAAVWKENYENNFGHE